MCMGFCSLWYIEGEGGVSGVYGVLMLTVAYRGGC